ncbi:phosphatidylserine decarboxylase [Saitoella complicata NRRL Y-17804]|uniref:phosphatidylserine decarboxylase n=1 Tax=Saitoella complicata (strain BCRC 22490 / CBS 7301 / JCM 7358 / NBRC 10748 / NRRL Y-17804) TaxID=698492 RepID=UPI000867758C|nr:phosphatidylserine decarboxylase [Saitoella complicata NRRL Y-17804]ODQ54591.1 phosphatidylserine decarboxylase [Saitoella complicata NRRL Y-17804]
MAALISYAHSLADKGLESLNLLEKRQVGWMTKNRKTGIYLREQQHLTKKLKLLVLFSKPVEWIDTTWAGRYYLHEKNDEQKIKEEKAKSKEEIKGFIDYFEINMGDYEPSDPAAYDTFQAFFTRHHRPGARPIAASDNDSVAVCVADSRVVVYDTVTQTKKLWIKGRNFSISNLLNDPTLAEPWSNGSVASFRLSPQDYHRYHSPVSGTVKWWKELDGEYYDVDPICLQSDIDILTANARSAMCIDSPAFGLVLFVAIGAVDVGTVKLNPKFMTEGASVRKGDEVGIFEFGGSSIIVAFEGGRVAFDEDLREVSLEKVMMDVEVGMRLGEAVRNE